MWRVKNAARPCRVLKAATTTSTSVAYPTPVHRVKHPGQNYSGRRDRRAPIPPAPTPRPARGGCGAAALSLLAILLGLQCCDLSQTDRRQAIDFAQMWVQEIVDARQAEGMV